MALDKEMLQGAKVKKIEVKHGKYFSFLYISLVRKKTKTGITKPMTPGNSLTEKSLKPKHQIGNKIVYTGSPGLKSSKDWKKIGYCFPYTSLPVFKMEKAL